MQKGRGYCCRCDRTFAALDRRCPNADVIYRAFLVRRREPETRHQFIIESRSTTADPLLLDSVLTCLQFSQDFKKHDDDDDIIIIIVNAIVILLLFTRDGLTTVVFAGNSL